MKSYSALLVDGSDFDGMVRIIQKYGASVRMSIKAAPSIMFDATEDVAEQIRTLPSVLGVTPTNHMVITFN